jgi:hypothetical protein
MAKIGRNDDCPCGSGKKYKHCHLGKSIETADGQIVAGEPESGDLARRAIPGLVLTLVLGAIGAFWKGGEGLLVGASIGAFAGIGWALMQNPPPPTNNSSGSSINFGG